MTTVATLVVRLRGDIKDFVDKMEAAEKRIGQMSRRMKRGIQIAGVAAVAALGLSVKAFTNFDAGMTQSLAIMGNVSDTMREDMANAAREMALVTKFSAREAADAYFFLASAGLNAEASIAALPAVAAFAQAGMFDMARATDLLTDAQSALGKTIRDDAQANLRNMTELSDKIVKANTLANASVEQFAEALQNRAGAAARSLGKDVSEILAVLAAFADQGIKGAEAGTRLDIVLRDLQTKALANKEIFEEFGITVFEGGEKMANIADIIEDITDALHNKSDAEKRNILTQLGFSDRSVAATIALLGTADAMREYEEGIDSAFGITADVAAAQLETFNEQLGLLKSEFIDIGIELGSRVTPGLTKLVGALQKIPRPVKVIGATLVIVTTIFAALLVSIPLISAGLGVMAIGWAAVTAGAATATTATATFIAASAPLIAIGLAAAAIGAGLADIGLRTFTGKGLKQTFEERNLEPETFDSIAQEEVAASIDRIRQASNVAAGVTGALTSQMDKYGLTIEELDELLGAFGDTQFDSATFTEELDGRIASLNKQLGFMAIAERDSGTAVEVVTNAINAERQAIVTFTEESDRNGASAQQMADIWDSVDDVQRQLFLDTESLSGTYEKLFSILGLTAGAAVHLGDVLAGLAGQARGGGGATGFLGIVARVKAAIEAASLLTEFGVDIPKGIDFFDPRSQQDILDKVREFRAATEFVGRGGQIIEDQFTAAMNKLLGVTEPTAAGIDAVRAAMERLIKTRENDAFAAFLKGGENAVAALRRRNALLDSEFQIALDAWEKFGGDVALINRDTFDRVVAELEAAAQRVLGEGDFLQFLQARRQGGLANTGDGSVTLPSGATLGGPNQTVVSPFVGAAVGGGVSIDNSVSINTIVVPTTEAAERVPDAISAAMLAGDITNDFAGQGNVGPRRPASPEVRAALEEEGILF